MLVRIVIYLVIDLIINLLDHMDRMGDMIQLIHLIMDKIEEMGPMEMEMILWDLINLEILLEIIIIDQECLKDQMDHLTLFQGMEGLGEDLEEDLEVLEGKIISSEVLLAIN